MTEVLPAGLIVAGLVIPGWGWARVAGAGLVGAMMISWLSLFAMTLACTFYGWEISLRAYLIGQVLVAAGGGGLAWKRQVSLKPGGVWKPTGVEWAALPCALVAGWKAVRQPLSGVDVDFRWNYLAELMVARGNLDFYPPVSSSDFSLYFWADGIPPLVAAVYAWTYLVAGDTHRIWTAIPVGMQVVAGWGLLRLLGRHWGGDAGGRWAVVLGAGTFLLQFAFNLGQETGYTALGAALMVYYLLPQHAAGPPRSVALAAAGAALVVAAREYGWAIAAVGVAAYGFQWVRCRLPWRSALGWGWLLLPALWYVRTWWLSGNPWLSLTMGGWFEVNPVFAAWMEGYRELYGESIRGSAGWLETIILWGRTASPALVGLLAGAVAFWRQPGWGVTVAVALAAGVCWWLSVPYTAGGPFYAMRVLSPLLLLGCGWGGAALLRWVPGPRGRAGLAVVAGLVVADASLRALTVPANPWRTPPGTWISAGYGWQQEFRAEQDPFLDDVLAQTQGRFISDSAGVQRHFRRRGRDLVPLWSPEVRPLFDPTFDGDAVAVLRERGFTHLLVNRSGITFNFLDRSGALARLDGRIHGIAANEVFAVFVLLPTGQ